MAPSLARDSRAKKLQITTRFLSDFWREESALAVARFSTADGARYELRDYNVRETEKIGLAAKTSTRARALGAPISKGPIFCRGEPRFLVRFMRDLLLRK